jgi:hypothetical protein
LRNLSEEKAVRLEVAARELNLPMQQAQKLVDRGLLRPVPTEKFCARRYDRASIENAKRELEKLRFLAVITPDNWETLCAQGLTFTGIPRSRALWAPLMRHGTQIAFYCTQYSTFVGVAEVTDKPKAKTLLLPSGPYPFTVPLRPIVTLPPSEGVSVKDLIPSLEFMANKTHWEFYVRSSLQHLKDADFERIEIAVVEESLRRPAIRIL